MLPEIKQFNLADVYVQITEPFIYVADVFLLDVFELIRLEVKITEDQRHFELACVDGVFSANNWKDSPAVGLIFARVFPTEVHKFKQDHV